MEFPNDFRISFMKTLDDQATEFLEFIDFDANLRFA